MIITGMAHFESVCKKKLVDWYNENGFADTPVTPPIDLSNVFVVWSCKTLQNYKSEAESRASGNEESITAICGILQQMQGTRI